MAIQQHHHAARVVQVAVPEGLLKAARLYTRAMTVIGLVYTAVVPEVRAMMSKAQICSSL